jgi:hypothetical protein
MAIEHLNPDQLTFRSFQHSQGIYEAQVCIFEYFKRRWGLQPNLAPSDEQLAKYAAYITQPNNKIHLGYDPDADNPASRPMQVARNTFKEILDYQAKSGFKYMDDEAIYEKIADTLVAQETRILDMDNAWESFPADNLFSEKEVRRQRLNARVWAGKSSFLLLHGRDGVTTGSAQFDRMYQEIYPYVLGLDTPDKDSPYKRHQRIVEAAELAILGKTALAFDADDGQDYSLIV